jgi:hypothetical protein
MGLIGLALILSVFSTPLAAETFSGSCHAICF